MLKQNLIDKITSLLYDFTADELSSIYTALLKILYKEDKTNGLFKRNT